MKRQLNTVTLKQVNNDYYLNGQKGNYSNFNMDGKLKQLCYAPYINNKGQQVRLWIFEL